MFEFIDDEQLTRTKQLILTISTLRRLRDSIARTVRAWDDFEKDDIKAFELYGLDALRQRWQRYLSNIRAHIAELRYYNVC